MKKIKIELLSDLLCASGNSTAFIDAEAKFDKYGLPYIPAKSFKGVLKEAALEVIEITNSYSNDDIDALFGSDKSTGSITVDNCKIVDHGTICNELEQNKIPAVECIKYFTTDRTQTAIDDGIAKETSLRKYRLIKKGVVAFETLIDFDSKYNELMDKVILQLRYIGLRRNRGFGKIKLNASDSPAKQVNRDQVIEFTENQNDDKSLHILNYSITALNPLHLSKPIGDQNTEGTFDYIPGSAIRGIVAKAIIHSNSLNKKAHLNTEFKNLILKNCSYSNAYIAIKHKPSMPIPLAIAYNKHDKNETLNPTNILEEEVESPKNYKKWCDADFNLKNNTEVALTQQFHHRRKNRVEGKSTDDEGAIFYYESIEEEQQFNGYITGPKPYLTVIKSILETNNFAVGSSKSTQYGSIDLCCEEIMNLTSKTIKTNSEYYLVLLSHTIVLNKYGNAEPTTKTLSNYLAEKGLELISEKYACKTVRLENFYTPWKSNSDNEYAYAMGSTFKVKTGNTIQVENDLTLGERTIEGFGRFQLFENLNCSMQEDASKTEKSDINEPINSLTLHSLTSKIIASISKNNNEEIIKERAFSKAKETDKAALSNHQISRLKYIIENLNESKLQEFIDGLSKKIDPSLSENSWRTALINSYYDMINKKENTIIDVESFKLYWNHVFTYLRKKNNKSK